MAREFFKNLPDKSTPLTAPRLNRMLNGKESIEKIVVGDIECKNLLNSDEPDIINESATWIGSGRSHKLSKTTAWGGCVSWFMRVKAGETYTFSYKQRNSDNLYLYIKEMIAMNLDGASLLKTIVGDGTGTEYSFTTENDCYLLIYFDNSSAISDVLIEEIQLERGTTKTSFSLFKKIGYNSTESMGKILVDDISCKNLFNIQNFEAWSAIVKSSSPNTIVFEANGLWAQLKYHFVLKKKTNYVLTYSFGINTSFIPEVQVQGNNYWGNSIAVGGAGNVTLYFNSGDWDTIDVVFPINGEDGSTATGILSDVQLEEGSTPTEVAPYKSLGYISGSNGNGSWVKYDDGRMECWKEQIIVGANMEAKPITFPAEFSDNVITIICTNNFHNHKDVIFACADKTVNGFNVFPTRNGDTITTDESFGYHAIGRWK